MNDVLSRTRLAASQGASEAHERRAGDRDCSDIHAAAVGQHNAVGNASKQGLKALLAGLRNALHTVGASRQTAVRRRRGLLQRKLLLGTELLCKLEEQVLFPALAQALQTSASSDTVLGTVQRELVLLRDLSMLVSRTAAGNRDTVVSVLEGVAALHADHVDALIEKAPATHVPWAALESDMRGLLGRWRDEVLSDGDIDDEDHDPVGLPPR